MNPGVSMRYRQRGITAIGFVLIAAIAVIIGFAILRLMPMYMEQMKIAQVLSDVKSELDGQAPNPTSISKSLKKRLDVESVSAVEAQDFAITKTEYGYELGIFYEDRTSYLGNLYLVLEFDNSVEIRR